MRIAYFAFIELGVSNASVVHTREIAEQLAALGHDVHLILPKPLENHTWHGVHHIWVRWWGYDRKRKWAFFLESAWRIWRLHRQQRIDLLYVREMARHPFLSRFCELLGIPLFVEVNGWLLDDFKLFGASERNMKHAERCQNRLLQSARGILASTVGNAENVINYYGIHREKVLVQELGVNPNLFSPRDKALARQKLELPYDDGIVLYAGNFYPHYDLMTLLSAFAELLKRGEKASLALVGDGGMFQEVTEEVQRLEISDHVIMPGMRPYAEMPNWLNAADVAVIPLRARKIEQQKGALATKMWEAMSCGTCVLVTDQKNTSSYTLLSDIAYVIEPESISDMAQALFELLGAPDRRKEISARARAYAVSCRTWRKAAQETEEFICKRLQSA